MNSNFISEHLRDRLTGLKKEKGNGTRIVGYFPGSYVPEEIIYAAGAIPICLADGGNRNATEVALSLVPRIICPFARGQIGEMLLKTNPYYDNLLDLVVAPIACQHVKKVAEIWEYYRDVEVFKLGVPHQYDGDLELEYYTDRLRVLMNKLASLTGNRITNEKLRDAIRLYNRMRSLLKSISFSRQNPSSPVNATDFIKLNHDSFLADPVFMITALETVNNELNKEKAATYTSGPRILLTGPNLTRGDYRILELTEAAGGRIVIEEFFEGIRYYWHNIEEDGDPLRALAAGYLRDRLPAAFMRSSTAKRFHFLNRLITDFKVAGVIWYELQCCETYDQEAFFLHEKLQEKGIPILTVESTYDTSDAGPLKTRVDAFIELIQGGMDNA